MPSQELKVDNREARCNRDPKLYVLRFWNQAKGEPMEKYLERMDKSKVLLPTLR